MSKKQRQQPSRLPAANLGQTGPMLEAVIGLLGRFVFPEEKLREMVTKRKNPEQYVKAYNLCDGEHTGTEIAKSLNLDQGGLSRILADWKDMGIIYEISKLGGKFYKRLYKLEPPKEEEISEQIKVETEEPSKTETPIQQTVTESQETAPS